MNKVLIITYDFLPYSSSFGACARIFKLAHYLSENGFEVSILSSKGKAENYFGFKDEISKYKCYYVSDPFKYSKDSVSNFEHSSKSRILQKGLAKIKSVVKGSLIPDARRLLVKNFTKTSRKLIVDNNINNIIISSPPHSIQLVGLNLKSIYEESINLIVDYRDSWNTVRYFQKSFYISKLISERLEKQVLKNCDHFTYISEPILRKVIEKYNLRLENKSTLVMNGYISEFDEVVAPEKKISTKKIKIGYFGSLLSNENSYRNIRLLLDTINKDNTLRSRLQLLFYGEINISNYKTENCDFIEIHPTLSFKAAEEKMKEMSALLIIHSDVESCEEVITGKFFDYIKLRLPILVIAPPNMEAFKMVHKFDLGFTVNISSETEISAGLHDFIRNSGQKYEPNIDLSYFSANKQFSNFKSILR